jgi:hypothetical protein
VSKIDDALRILGIARDPLPRAVDLLRWFDLFAQLRNATKAHGATLPTMCAQLVDPLSQSIRLIEDRVSILQSEWSFLHRNLSGKYRVTAMSTSVTTFAFLRSTREVALADGIYLWADAPRPVPLFLCDADLSDYFLPNGGFNDQSYETLSYLTDDRRRESSIPFLVPIGALPPSETHGIGRLDAFGTAFSNVPQQQRDYVVRAALERELRGCLLDDRHPLITMSGRGGVGKTSTALRVLHDISTEDRFSLIVWFSSRDIDLLPSGPKPVAPHVLSEQDVANEFVRLVAPSERVEKGFKPRSYIEKCMQTPEHGPTLYVFDNFETATSPKGLFAWLHTHLRLPNKVLITTRFRDFNADYRVDVGGMTQEECDLLIEIAAGSFGIASLLTRDYRERLYQESDGHPYVLKILLGRVAREHKLVPIDRVMSAEDDVLDSLFERSYTTLSPAAKRVFLLLASWRSAVPEVAIEAILLRPANERMQVRDAIDELLRSSFVDLRRAQADEESFLVLPLAAMLYGRRKLDVSPLKAAVEADRELLLLFGATADTDLRLGLKPRVERFVRAVAERIDRGEGSLDDYVEIIRFLARRYPPAWLLLAGMFEERGTHADWIAASEAVESFLQTSSSEAERAEAWEHQEALAKRLPDAQLELAALVERASLPSASLEVISRAANRVNAIFSADPFAVDRDEKRVLARRLISLFERRVRAADGTDLSRLAWLYLRVNDSDSARRIVTLGLRTEPSNQHIQNLDRYLRTNY